MKIISKKNLNIASELNELSLSLNKLHYASEEKIHFYSQKLSSLINKINELLITSDIFSKGFLEEQLNKALSLYGRCDNLKIDSAVVYLAKKAQKLSHTNTSFLEEKITLIKKTISVLKKDHALSSENRKIIRFIEIIIHSLNSNTIFNDQEIDQLFKPIDTESAFSLLEIAEYLYKNKINLAKEYFFSLNKDIQKNLENELKNHGLDQNDIFYKKNITKTIQIIVGFCDQLSFLQKETILPSLEEIKNIFNDLED